MKCPYCEKEIPGTRCQQCGATSPEGANYCMECGFTLEQKVEGIIEDVDAAQDNNGVDLENRILCPDGTCTGIIVDGRCIECGKVFQGEEKVIEK